MNRTLMIILLVVCVLALILMFAVVLPRIKHAFARIPTITYVIIGLLLIAAIVVLAINIFAPHGFEASDTDPAAVDVNTETRWSGETVYIYVHGNEISVGETPMLDESECVSEVKAMADEGAKEIYLVDDYAQADVYKEIMKGLDKQGIKYLTKQQ